MTQPHTNGRLKESLSVVMDGEANEMELHRVLASMQDREICQTASNYQLIGNVLRKQNTPMMHIDLSERIRAEIDAEPELSKAKSSSIKVIRGIGRMAIAASVTLAVILGVRTWNTETADQSPSIAQSFAIENNNRSSLLLGQTPDRTQNYNARGLLAGSQAEQTSLTPGQLTAVKNIASSQTLERFKAYSLNHAEQLAARNMQGMLPFIRAVSFQSH